METIYRYDGSFEGFLCCVFDSYVYREVPAAFQSGEDIAPTLFEVRWIETDPSHARRVLAGIEKRSAYARELVEKGFLTCADDREGILYRFIRALLAEGGALLCRLSDEAVHPLLKAVRHLEGEVHLLKGFVRFSEFSGVLVGEIQPKNRVLPLLRGHFCSRFYNESLILYDRTHREALFYREGKWCISPLDHFEMARPEEREAQFRRLWKRFYDTIAIRERYNPKCRRTQMPMRYWGTMTEFQKEDYFVPAEKGAAAQLNAVPPSSLNANPVKQNLFAAAPAPGAPAGIPAPEKPRGSAPSGPGSAP